MIPSLQQYRKWSLPAKYTFWALLLAFVPIGWGIGERLFAIPEDTQIFFNYATSEITIFGGEATSPETAVIIRGAQTHIAGVAAELFWIKKRYPGYKTVAQGILVTPRRFDVLHLRNWYGARKKVYFDIEPFIDKPLCLPQDQQKTINRRCLANIKQDFERAVSTARIVRPAQQDKERNYASELLGTAFPRD